MAVYAVQSAVHAGTAIDKSVAPATTGNTAPTGVGVGLLVNNGSASSITVTLHVPTATTVDGLVVPNRTVTVAAGAETLIPLTSLYADPATGRATFDISAVTTVTAAVVRVA